MDLKSLEIKNKTNYVINNISYIDYFNVNSLRVTKKESRIGVIIWVKSTSNIINIRFIILDVLLTQMMIL